MLPHQGVTIWHRVFSYGLSSEKPAWTSRGTYDRQLGWISDDNAFGALQTEGDLYQLGLGSSPDDIKSFISVPEVGLPPYFARLPPVGADGVNGLFGLQYQLRSSNGAPLQDSITIYFRSRDTSEPFHLKYTAADGAARSGNCSGHGRAPDFTTELKLEYPHHVQK